jgi:hypothetical protein
VRQWGTVLVDAAVRQGLGRELCNKEELISGPIRVLLGFQSRSESKLLRRLVARAKHSGAVGKAPWVLSVCGISSQGVAGFRVADSLGRPD